MRGLARTGIAQDHCAATADLLGFHEGLWEGTLGLSSTAAEAGFGVGAIGEFVMPLAAEIEHGTQGDVDVGKVDGDLDLAGEPAGREVGIERGRLGAVGRDLRIQHRPRGRTPTRGAFGSRRRRRGPPGGPLPPAPLLQGVEHFLAQTRVVEHGRHLLARNTVLERLQLLLLLPAVRALVEVRLRVDGQ